MGQFDNHDLRRWVREFRFDKQFDYSIFVLVKLLVILCHVVNFDAVCYDQVDWVDYSRNQVIVQDFFPILMDRSLPLELSVFHTYSECESGPRTFPMKRTPFSMTEPMLK